MASVIIYSKQGCPYCDRAKMLLGKKGVSFEEIPVDLDAKQLDIMIKKSQRRCVPQIFINDRSIGGFDDLVALDRKGELDTLLV